MVYIPHAVCQELQDYCKQAGINSGIVFSSKTNRKKLLAHSSFWRDLNKIAKLAGIKRGIIHPHNFRHFFAKEFYIRFHNLPDLADILGHASLETTRIYTRTTFKEKQAMIAALAL